MLTECQGKKKTEKGGRGWNRRNTELKEKKNIPPKNMQNKPSQNKPTNQPTNKQKTKTNKQKQITIINKKQQSKIFFMSKCEKICSFLCKDRANPVPVPGNLHTAAPAAWSHQLWMQCSQELGHGGEHKIHQS